jgi:hypothetical protein
MITIFKASIIQDLSTFSSINGRTSFCRKELFELAKYCLDRLDWPRIPYDPSLEYEYHSDAFYVEELLKVFVLNKKLESRNYALPR